MTTNPNEETPVQPETKSLPAPDPILASNSQPTQWLPTRVEQHASPAPTTVRAEGRNRFSFWLVLALIIGIVGPALACGLGAVLPFLPRVQPGMTGFATWTLIAIGLWGLPLAAFALWEMMNQKSPGQWRLHWVWSLIGGVGAALLLVVGGVADYFDNWPIPAAALTMLVYLTLAGLALLALVAHSWRGFGLTQAWAHLVGGGWLGLSLAAIVEVGLLLVLIVVLVIASLVRDPEQVRLFIQNSQALTESQIQQLVLEWAFNPWVIVLVFLGASVVAPLIEESLKPVLVALSLFRGPPTPMAAFLGGVMSGVGFGVIESLSQLVNTAGGQWALLAGIRVGTLVMHGLASGLVGWGWGQLAVRKPLRLIGAFALAVAIHGLWNAMAITSGLVGLRFTQINPAQPSAEMMVLGLLMLIAIATLGLMTVSGAAALIFIGWRLRASETSEIFKISEVLRPEPPTRISAEPASAASARVVESAGVATPTPGVEPGAAPEPPPRQ